MQANSAPCEKCTTEISTDAEICPSCGYEPASSSRTVRKVFLVVGWFLTISIIGSPIGIPMLLLYYIADRRVEGERPASV